MCVIVDANRLGDFLGRHDDSIPIHDWIERGAGELVYSTGASFKGEIGVRHRRKLAELHKAGRARLVPAEEFADAEARFRDRAGISSDDPHVLALAEFSGVRLLYTHDQLLMDDFKDPGLLSRPRGKVYKRAEHRSLLDEAICPPRMVKARRR